MTDLVLIMACGAVLGAVIAYGLVGDRIDDFAMRCHRHGGEVTITRTAGELVFDCKKPDEGQ